MALSVTPQRLQAFLGQALTRIELTPELEEAIAIGQWISTYLWKNNHGLYHWDALEERLTSKVHAALGNDQSTSQRTEPTERTELHVATEVYAFGGHSSLMRQLVQQGTPHAIDVLVTGTDAVANTASCLGIPPSRVLKVPRADTALDRIRHTLNAMRAYQQLVLHIHPNDLETALAVRLLKAELPDVRVHFVNHADHAYSVAIGAANRVLEISQYGWALRSQRDSLERSSFLGIPIQISADLEPKHPTDSDKILTGGASFKFQPVGKRSLPSALATMLQREKISLDVIGPKKGDWWWWPLKARFPTRVKIHRMLPKEQYQKLLKNCSLYIDSYPLPGGTAFPEALMRGCKVSGMLGLVWGYSPADELLASTPEDFLAQCKALVLNDPEQQIRQDQARAKCIQYHAPQHVRRRLDEVMSTDRLIQPPPSPLPPPSTQSWAQSWMGKHAPAMPSSRESSVSPKNRRWLARQQLAMHGLRHRSAWRLLRHAFS